MPGSEYLHVLVLSVNSTFHQLSTFYFLWVNIIIEKKLQERMGWFPALFV